MEKKTSKKVSKKVTKKKRKSYSPAKKIVGPPSPDDIKAKSGPQWTYKPEYCEMLKKHMAEGMSFVSFGAVVNAGASTLYDWANQFPEFKEARMIGQSLAQSFMEKRLVAKMRGAGTNGINAKDVDGAALIFALKTRFHKTYGEKKEVESKGEIKVVIDKEDLDL